MKNSRFPLATAAALVAMLVAGSMTVAAADGPKLVVPEKIKDMGTVAQGEILEINFELVKTKATRPSRSGPSARPAAARWPISTAR